MVHLTLQVNSPFNFVAAMVALSSNLKMKNNDGFILHDGKKGRKITMETFTSIQNFENDICGRDAKGITH